MTWDDIRDDAAALPGAEVATYYGKPAVKANGRAIVTTSHEADGFCLHIDRDTVEMLKETDPATFWQTPHYAGWPVVLVRYATDDPERVRALVVQAYRAAMASPPARPRRTR